MRVGVSFCQKPWQQHALYTPHAIALRTANQTYTWQQLTNRIDAYAFAMQQQGLQNQDVLTLVGKNSLELVLIYLASLKLGVICAITMPQPVMLLKQKLSTLYGENQPHHWLWLGEGAKLEESELTSLLAEANIQLFTHEHITNEHVSPPTSAMVNKAETQFASIIFTSGSTGVPKAVIHTFQQHWSSASGLLEVFSFSCHDTWLLSLPMYHVSGLAIIYRWLVAGACLKVGSGDLTQDIIHITHASLVATQLKRLLDSKTPLALTHVLLGGGHIPNHLALQAAKQGIETWVGYGMTEAASTVTAKRVNASQSVGHVLPKRQVKLQGQRIFIGGETISSGYYQQGLITPLIDEQGWFDSQDLGHWQNDELCIIGRVDNQFISGGENIHCEEIEAILSHHPDIALAMVIPVHDDEFGARSVALLQCQTMPKKEALEQWLNGRLERFKYPIDYFLIPNHLSETGIKISRKTLKTWLTEHQLRYRPLNERSPFDGLVLPIHKTDGLI
ncbi:o-succinylbenzoate--CoA ligase [Vibrio sp. V23_P3S9T160]|uniref:o-succinylbenzoate--CoA ligase n=2 Tax=unclassified Vibrio TaxID=2614977 RepID=UPI0013723E9C|nr:o-succinylbenzoate--CoA ligase [Vibrio sp. V23_P3S9T160]NAW98632.1 o-succinylbenzoate--CoA ligase [Vibrio sp. V23_P3S9T160]